MHLDTVQLRLKTNILQEDFTLFAEMSCSGKEVVTRFKELLS